MRKIMILGAGIYQVPLIIQAKKLGYYVICISIKGNYPGFQYADKVHYIDTRDEEAILAIAQKEEISGICTTGTDVALRSIGYVNDRMNLNGISYEAAQRCADKSLMKEFFWKNGVSTPRFKRVTSVAETISWMKETGIPIVLKPVDSSGSRGVTKANTASDVIEAFERAKKSTKKEYLVAEQFLEGQEVGVDAFVVNHKNVFVSVHGKITYFNGSSDVPIGHYFPAKLQNDTIRLIEDECQKVVTALDLNHCAVNMDVMICGNKPYILEASGRCGATCIPELISRCYGINYYEQIILSSLGMTVNFKQKKGIPCIGKLLMSQRDGIIIEQQNKSNDPNIDVQFDFSIGDRVRKFCVGPDRIGHIVSNGNKINENEIVQITIR